MEFLKLKKHRHQLHFTSLFQASFKTCSGVPQSKYSTQTSSLYTEDRCPTMYTRLSHRYKKNITAKENLNKTKRQPTEWDKIFANDVTGKGLISNIYKQLIQLNIKKTT